MALLATAWLLGMARGGVILLRFETTAGEDTIAAPDWLAGSPIPPRPDSYNLVLAIHPHCPCSQAMIEELSRVLVRCPRHVQIHVLLWQPASASDDWQRTDLLERIRDLGIFLDQEGIEAERFGARTSGSIVLYGKDGRLLFHGGITASRGQEGKNAAAAALQSRLCAEASDFCSTPVYGCPLDDGSPRGGSTCKP